MLYCTIVFVSVSGGEGVVECSGGTEGLFIAVTYLMKTANCDTDAKSKTNFEH